MFSIYGSFGIDFWFVCLLYLTPITFTLISSIMHGTDTGAGSEKRDCEPVFTAFDHRIFLFLCSAYTMSMAYRYIFLGGVLGLGITGARYEEIHSMNSGGGIFTALTVFTSAAPAFLFLSVMERTTNGVRRNIIPIILVVLGLLMSFLSGGRNSFLISIVFMYFAGQINPNFSIRRATGAATARNIIIKAAFGAVLIFGIGLSLYIFVERALMRTDDLIDRAAIHAYENGLGFDRDAIPLFIPDYIYIILFYVHAYFTIGFHYLQTILTTGMPNGHLNGGYNFYIYCLTIDRVLGTSLAPNLSEDLRIFGAYYTLPGSIFIDFGLSGVLVVTAFIMFMAARSVAMFKRGCGEQCFFAALMFTVLFFSPLYNAVSVGPGASLLLFSTIYLFLKRGRARSC
ncbi:hypothetical protein [Pseudogemmobacter faecipullorum]|uniref:Oligosaccharide repeat unit polymerase n=1 Tax=Pseudogemmobacter faecipullorum TaxID=2755041 RepID=A0ABS8CRC3_9RHOB|nr:hypothetical protein [Pseudogemmobacter faecipullorum]MCB5411954.1 hypothetical protein [Pseudogemmobacter faecipullorum]